ncbi:MAG TPA: FAD:protein FMN transferase, partial [Polyangia bacterium]
MKGSTLVPVFLAAATSALAAFSAGGCGKSPDATTKAGSPVAAARVDTAPVAAAEAKQVFTVNRKCMGTLCEIKAFHHDKAVVQRAVEQGMAEMDRIEALMTSWTDTSDVAKVNAAAGVEAVRVDPDTLAVVKKG